MTTASGLDREHQAHEWLGDLPAHWELERLKYSITRIEQGWSPQCDSRPAEADEWGVLKVGCVNGSEFSAEEQKALPIGLEPMPAYEIKADDILMSRGNTRELVGLAARVGDVRGRLMICDLLYRFRARPDKAVPEFLVMALRSPYVRHQIEREATGTSASMKKIGQETIRELLICLPPLEEQETICDWLGLKISQIDALIAKKQRQIELLIEKRQALISQAVTKGLDPAAPMKDSGIPGWARSRVIGRSLRSSVLRRGYRPDRLRQRCKSITIRMVRFHGL